MAAIETNRASLASASVFSALASRVVNAITSWQDIRATRNALAGLSDRELDDIGLCRGDIDAVAGKF